MTDLENSMTDLEKIATAACSMILHSEEAGVASAMRTYNEEDGHGYSMEMFDNTTIAVTGFNTEAAAFCAATAKVLDYINA